MQKLIEKIPWDTLPPWAVIVVVCLIIIGLGIVFYFSQKKKPNATLEMGSENKGVKANISENSAVNMGDQNTDVNIKIGGKR